MPILSFPQTPYICTLQYRRPLQTRWVIEVMASDLFQASSCSQPRILSVSELDVGCLAPQNLLSEIQPNRKRASLTPSESCLALLFPSRPKTAALQRFCFSKRPKLGGLETQSSPALSPGKSTTQIVGEPLLSPAGCGFDASTTASQARDAEAAQTPPART